QHERRAALRELHVGLAASGRGRPPAARRVRTAPGRGCVGRAVLLDDGVLQGGEHDPRHGGGCMTSLPHVPPRSRTPLSEPFWRAAREGRLVFQRCGECGYVRWPPGPLCPECLAPQATWEEVEARGSVWSYCVYDHCYDE